MKVEPGTRSTSIAPQGGRLNWRRIGKITLIVIVLFGLLAGAGAFALWKYVDAKLGDARDEAIVTDPLPPGKPYNILVIGSDRRDVVDPSQRNQRQFRGGGGRRADTIMLIHVSTDGKRAVGLSFPRDLRVRIPGHKGYSKINAAYNEGPNKVIETVKSLTGLGVHHYVEVNFNSFRKIVDAVGGLRMCVTRGYDDPQSGLKLPGKGCYDFDGDLALSFVRMRKSDPEGDFGRIKRQQLFMRTLMSKVTSVGFITDIPRLIRLVNAVAAGIVIDKELSLAEIRGIANRLSGFKQSNVDFRVVPSFPKYISGVSYVVMREAAAESLFKAMREDAELPDVGKTGLSLPKPADVKIQIQNGTTTAGFARSVQAELEKLGFDVRAVKTAGRTDYTVTEIIFAPGAELKANLLADEFPGAKVVESVNVDRRYDVVIVLGTDAVSSRASASPSPGG